MKLLVGASEDHARDIADALELDRAKWHICGVGAALTGRRYEKVVVFMRPTSSATESSAIRKYIDVNLATKLPVKQKPVLL